MHLRAFENLGKNLMCEKITSGAKYDTHASCDEAQQAFNEVEFLQQCRNYDKFGLKKYFWRCKAQQK